MKNIKFIIAVLILLICTKAYATDDFQYWSQLSLKMLDTKHIDWTLFSEARVYNDAADTGLYYFSSKLTYDYINHVQFGTNYTYLNYKSQAVNGELGGWRYQHRAEVEVNPYFNISENIKVINRNRVEFRWIENNGAYNTRLRHRWTMKYAIKDLGALSAVYTSSEFIYNVAEHSYDENRTVPIGLSFKISEKLTTDVYYLIQSKKGSDDWYSNQVFGTLFSYKF